MDQPHRRWPGHAASINRGSEAHQQGTAAAQVIYGEKAAQRADGGWHLTDGSRLDADVVYSAVGGQPNTAFLQPLGILDARGAIKVHPGQELSRIAA